MRLIGHLEIEEQAASFSDFLSRKGIANQYEKGGEKGYNLWIHREEDLDVAFNYYQKFILHPEDALFTPPLPKSPEVKIRPHETKVSKASFFLTHAVLVLCAFLFFWDGKQESSMKKSKDPFVSEFSLTPLQKALFFDEPKAVDDIEKFIQEYGITSLEEVKKEPLPVQSAFEIASTTPYWKGIVPVLLEKIQKKPVRMGPLFEKTREGEVWRLVSPSFLHRDFIHIFFNMAWLLILGKQIELRLKKYKMVLLILLLAAFSNTMQYLISGPYFLGFSGVVTGLAGFIWSRQKKAPWEGYPLNRTTSLFLFYFVLVLLLVSITCFTLQALGVVDFISSIANTAHISGGILGLVLGRASFFSRTLSK